jgi:hypothetical protein
MIYTHENMGLIQGLAGSHGKSQSSLGLKVCSKTGLLACITNELRLAGV